MPEIRYGSLTKAAGLAATLGLAALAAQLGAAELLSGRVLERRGEQLTPARKVLVTVWTDREVVGAARTDAQGRYSIAGPITGRVRIVAERFGYRVVDADGSPDAYLTADCRAACGPFDFIIERGAVVTGRVVDDLQQPLENARVRVDHPDDGRDPLQTRTDDRGEFRIPGVAPGDYVLSASGPFRGLSKMGYQEARREVTLDAGEERSFELALAPAGQTYFQISGVVTGFDESPGAVRSVVLRPAGRGGRSRGRGARAARIDAEGRFRIDRVPAGAYFARLAVRGGRRAGRSGALLGRLEVRSDLAGLTLTPQPEANLSGRIEWQGPARERRPLRLISLDGAPDGFIRYGVDQAFETSDLYPGRYRVAAYDEAFVREIRVGGDAVSVDEIKLEGGSLEDVTVVVSSALARLSGRIRSSAQESGGRFRVAVRGPAGVRSSQTDQYGRFELEGLVPGDYQIGAWSAADVRHVRTDEWWEQEQGAVRSFTVEPGSEIEIELTVAP